MNIDIKCKTCGAVSRFPQSAVGKSAKCSKCASIFTIAATAMAVPTSSAVTQAKTDDRWFTKDDTGAQYGPVTKAELDAWAAEGRLQAGFQVLREGDGQWRWATDVYPALAKSSELPEAVDLAADVTSTFSEKSGTSALSQRYRQSVKNRFRPSTSPLDIFDWKFEKYLTPWIVRVTWITILVLSLCWMVLITGSLLLAMATSEGGFEMSEMVESPTDFDVSPRRSNRLPEGPSVSAPPLWLLKFIVSIGVFISAMIGLAVTLLWIRVILEMTIVIFNIATTLSTIEEQLREAN